MHEKHGPYNTITSFLDWVFAPKNMGVVELTFHGTKVINLRKQNFYKKIVLQKENNKKSEVMT